MKKLFILLVFACGIITVNAQQASTTKDAPWEKIYRGSATKINDLVHTKLDVRFDYDKSWMYGKAWITLVPHFYPTDSLTLDAKGMDIKEVEVMKGTDKIPLKYKYDSLQLKITLDKEYKAGQQYIIYINYTAKPNEQKAAGSAAITDAKGLYFINPKGEDKTKPTEIWTQGETEANSVWMPTIDKPDQKTTEEIYMTVPSKYVTLSNGLLISQKTNSDGTRTDYWKLDLPHAPYLFFMGVGEYAIVKDDYKGKEVSYYVEKQYESVARRIFGNTPEMIGFYERILGVPYQWPKYSQIVGRDFVSGAMENTTATLHQESAYQNARQLTDGNAWEEVIAHELFHHWFGDLVTTESWSNITLNESFADYSEYLWDEYKYGKDFADDHNRDDMEGYLKSPDAVTKDLVRFHYADKEDVFDVVSYNKGGRILHMLRNYVGDSAFYKSLNLYLTTNEFKTGEAQQLRLAFEEVTGQDLNWFWNQWYYGSGHPVLSINYSYDDVSHNAYVYVRQTQPGKDPFMLPIAIDVYSGNTKTREKVWLKNWADTFTFHLKANPDLINVDADKVLLCEKTDNKTAANYIFQYNNAPTYLDRFEALNYFDSKGMKELALGLTDKYAGLRTLTINKLAATKSPPDIKVIEAIEKIADTEKDKKTKAAALSFLAQTGNAKYIDLFTKNVTDSSYSVAGAALAGLTILEPQKAYDLAKKYSTDAKGDLGDAVTAVIVKNGRDEDFDLVVNHYNDLPVGQDKYDMTDPFCDYLAKVKDIDKIEKAIDDVIAFSQTIPSKYRVLFTDKKIKASLDKVGAAKGKVIADYINKNFKFAKL
ncbi:MAG TPA: M1 family aminopeptidase [Ferruginibacter sp.]|jgi:aminopeptidase N|nr:M1 family aminopeptidase [Ferruginibacter sp.]